MLIHQTSKIQVLATEKSTNRKIGAAVQLWIVPRNKTVTDSRRDKSDATTQCRGCKLASNSGCYVGSYYVDATQRAHWKRNEAPATDAQIIKLVSGKFVRFGAYGNPSLIPLRIIRLIVKHASGYAGYFHDWDLMTPAKATKYGEYLMASCEPDNRADAQKLGLRTFTTRNATDPIPGNDIDCPSSRGVQCSDCQLCSGKSKKARSISIPIHGYQAKSASRSISA